MMKPKRRVSTLSCHFLVFLTILFQNVEKAEAEEIAETDGQKFLKLIPGFETSDSQLKLIGKMET